MLRSPAFGFPRKRTFLVGERATTVLATHVSSIAAWSVSGGTAILRLRAGTVFLDSPATAEALSISGGCNSGGATVLSLSALTGLASLTCSGNSLTVLDLTGLTALTTLNCSSNSLTTLDVTPATALATLNCASNYIASLDLGQNGSELLTTVDCASNGMTTLTLSGTHNAAVTTLSAASNALITVTGNLIELYAAGLFGGSANFSGGTNEAVDASDYAAALRNERGWTITANA